MNLRHSLTSLCFCALVALGAKASSNDIVAYFGGDGNEMFSDILPLSDGTYLICGGADDLDWVKVDAASRHEMTELAGLENSGGTGRYAFILRVDNDLSRVIDLAYFPKGAAEELRFMKTTNIPGATTGDLYVSGNIRHSGIHSNVSRPHNVFIGRLDRNFIDGIPSGLIWQHNFWSEGYVADYHPWDVRNDGKVILAEGQSHAADYGAIVVLDADTGERTVMPGWRNHIRKWHRIQTTPGKLRDDFIDKDFWGTADQYEPDLTWVQAYQRDNDFNIVNDADGNPIVTAEGYASGPLLFSRIYTKWLGSADLRSWTQEDFDLWQEDENGSYKKGRYPWDMIFSTPCDPDNISGTLNQNVAGYTGYRTQGGSKAIFGTSSIVVDRRNNDLYIGMNISSKLPGGNPDFEPVVIAYNERGDMIWWSRLYHETTKGTASMVDGRLVVTGYEAHTSTPDQYVDGIAVDYSKPVDDGEIIVNARCHGNNVENLWEGNTIAANPAAYGFKNGYSGTGGDMHLGWLGRMRNGNGQLLASTYVAEAAEGASFGSAILSDPNLDGWPNPNDGWLQLTTTRVVNNALKVTSEGYPIILATGRRTITTANANLKMPKPAEGQSSWNTFVRVYNRDLTLPLYSSLASGKVENGAGADNMVLSNVIKTRDGVIVVGSTQVDGSGNPKGNLINLGNVPEWGKTDRARKDAVIFYLKADNLYSFDDGYDAVESILPDAAPAIMLARNGDSLEIINAPAGADVTIADLSGRVTIRGTAGTPIDLAPLTPGIYIVTCHTLSAKLAK